MTAYANKAQLLANFLTHKKVTFFVNVECVFRCLFMCMSVFMCMLVCKVMRCKIYPQVRCLSYLYVNFGISV